MDERHEREQYFFDAATVDILATVVATFPDPCCLCAPRLGAELERRGVRARTLDIDERFAHLQGFRHYDLAHPTWLGEPFGLIVCDPPFFNLSLAQLHRAIRLLSRYDDRQPLLLSYLTRRSVPFLRAFARFGLAPTGYHPTYQTVQPIPRNTIAFYSNVSLALIGATKEPTS